MREDFKATPKLGFGCMRLPLLDPDDQKSIDIEQFKEMVDVFMEAGCTYFDTAVVYHETESEVALRKALVERYPREAYTVATKCMAWTCKTKEQAQGHLAASLERLGLDYVDYYLMHNVGGTRSEKFERFDMWNFAQQKKAEGVIKNVGFSMHDGPETLDALLTAHSEVDFVQLQVNYLDWDDPVVQARKNMEVAAKHGKPVVIMEPARGGQLIKVSDRVREILQEANPQASMASWAYRFCYNLPNVLTVLSGMSAVEHVRENVADFAANVPFSPEERAAMKDAMAELRSKASIPCTNCRYCVKGCPQNVLIPTILGLLNLESVTNNRELAKNEYSWQARGGYASQCIECGACEAMCPQGIAIIEALRTATERFEAPRV
ncbi:MAG: aldo/keto reductase [Eggerthellaceae bacterium]|nr:aldo/keto reductase [Eggerthellaceae bacterium]